MTSISNYTATFDNSNDAKHGLFRTIVIGNETLLSECSKLLLERDHEIVAVVAAPMSPAAQWAKQAGIAVHARPRDLLKAGLGRIDYLFSISNLAVLPAEVLALAARAAINFHDGPLPERAGLNTPVWALLEGAARHGVTWHLMNHAVDEGAVLAAEAFEIAEEETALSINTRCFEAGLRCFTGLVADLDGAVAAAVPQNRAPDRMYGRATRPDGAATIDWHQSAEDIARLVRALDFGLYANPVGAPKALLGERLLLVQQVTPLATVSGREPGTIILSGPTPVVATGTEDLRIDRLAALDGEVLSGSAIGDLLIQAQGFASLGTARKEQLNGLDAAAGRYEAWWRRRLQMRESLQLPQFRPRVGTAGAQPFVIDRALPQGIARSEALAALVLWLARAADRDTVDIGYSDSVNHALLGDVAGWFAPEIPLRLAIDFAAPLSAVADALQVEIAGLRRRVAISADLIARSPELRGRAAFGHPVTVQVVDRLADARASTEAVLDLTLCPAEGTLRWTCNATRLDRADAKDLARGFEAMCLSFVATPDAPAGTLSVLEPEERQRILGAWNATEGPVPQGPAWHRHFVAQAQRTPHSIAVTALGTSLTYAELDALSNRIARDLAGRGVGPEVLVGLHLSRSVEMLACLIGVHKAGGAYVPLDPSYPKDRIAHMIADSGLGLILSETALAAELPETPAPVLHVDTMAEAFAAQPSTPIEDGIEGGNLAYMIYTSGSTGLPKGVMVEHRTLLNFYAGMDRHIEPDGTWLAVTSLSFDISTLELMWPLMHGYHVVIASEREVRGDVIAADEVRPVGFSLFYFASSSAGSAAEQYNLLLEGARFADRNGFEAIWTPERHFHDFGGPYPNPAVAAAAIAAVTSRVQIRAGSVVGTLHHPLRIAEEWALVDNISNGRVGIAFASGWQPDDFVLNPGAYADRAGTLARCMDDVRALWRGQKRSYPGPLGHDVSVLTYPRPVQPELPVWITSAGNADTFREAGRVGANVLTHLLGQSIEEVASKIAAYREAWRAAGHPGEGRATLMLHTFLGESEEAVREAVRGPLIEYLRTSTNLLKQYAWSFPAFKKPAGGEKLELSDLSGEETDALLEHAFERYFETSGLFGTPDDNVALVARLAALGVDEIGCLVDFGVNARTVIDHFPAIARLREITQGTPATRERPLHDLMARHGVTHLQCTPSLLQMLAGDEASRPRLAALQRLMVGGEAFPPQLARDMTGLVSGSVMNMYGPTETTVWSAVHTLESGDAAPPLGRPLLNQQIYILDRRAQPVRQGTPGELVIGGAGVVRGYHARPELTAERFTAHPFNPGERAYRTGDLARQRADGTLEFLGRLDHQVKIRGYRIELGEIESALTAHADVTEAVVVARKEGAATRLVAYLAPRTGAPAVEDLRAYLRERLPDFMVPGNFVLLEALPRTPNGKIDRNALPEPVSVVVSNDEADGGAPASGIEAQIQAIWCDLLKLPQVRLTENFFDIGGHSLLAIQVHRRLAAELPQPVALTDIFRFPTIASLGAHLSGGNEDVAALDGQNRGQARRVHNQRRLAARAGMRG
ncbi:MupA/Atu3671 family FMN-dependent luciferase-like monooxygenase [Novosphingobium sp. AP12]|uniref:MupA/Atu3671 family FMN-dependent luciferase-like monooxygenase n=1 Tax=Novosphingobium sp. AP12 TaxID=1144305 RepID=UPI000271DDC8|nr:MupA/Atu3671 family FMN-dependent luciferase-like monooxygenase [Novosphingobium sp. AP12]EJL23397.1 natural product biosynthesis luciferase-like monooxygenase domain containing protein [Novosphingobium sp. AP12]